ncbi:MAG TPA: extensin family protein [Microvirga sp.]|nr:extensin family protein [Microvirga sp.]
MSEGDACRERLARLGVRFESRPALREGSCGAPEPLLVSALSENVAIEPAATMTCPVAEALARWTADVLTPESDRHLKTQPAKLLIGTSYECRNQRSGGKMSEHAFANGVDVMGFAFAARPNLAVTGQADGTPEGAFLDAARKGACPYFTTVLGPGSDAAHADHLHLDLRARRANYRICQ